MKYEIPNDRGDGWTNEIYPKSRYKMACCDCGLVHDLEFSIERITERFDNGTFNTEQNHDQDLKIAFRVRRNNRATGQMRRHMKKHI